jgi:hypothetical protein
MSLIMIAIEPDDPSRRYHDLGERLREFRVGDDCHIMGNVWMLNSESSSTEIHHIMLGIIHPDDRFIVGQLDQPWIPYNCPSVDDCYRF